MSLVELARFVLKELQLLGVADRDSCEMLHPPGDGVNQRIGVTLVVAPLINPNEKKRKERQVRPSRVEGGVCVSSMASSRPGPDVPHS